MKSQSLESGLAIALMVCAFCLIFGVVVYYLGVLAALAGGVIGAMAIGAARLLRMIMGGG